MKNIFLLIIILALSITLFSCSKKSESSVTNNSVIKYEIILPSPIIPPVSPQYNLVLFTNETGQNATLMNDFISGKIWNKTITLTESRRPIILQFNGTLGQNYCATTGVIISNIYVDNILKATLSTQPINGTTNAVGFGPLTYVLQ